jgi:hypothetical protein
MQRWVAGPLLLPGIATTPRGAWLLADRRARIPVRQRADGTVLELPERAPDGLLPVVQVEYGETPRVGR